jgi:chemotaxis protein methyltransferase CheR
MAADVMVDADYAAFVLRVRRLLGVDLNGYKPEQMRRRLTSLAARHGADTLSRFAEIMEKDEQALAAFKNFFTINVSEFLRDVPRWAELERRVLPELYQQGGRRPLKIWSAGCSYGAEPYSVAMLLDEMTPGVRHSIVATDIDETILARAQRGAGYLEADLRNVEPARRARCFTKEADGTFTVRETLRSRIRFQKQDLLAGVPDQGLDLIVCRNVVIYFTEDAKKALYGRMFAAMRPCGVLFVGGTEIVTGARDLGLDPMFTSFYRKVGARLAGAA